MDGFDSAVLVDNAYATATGAAGENERRAVNDELLDAYSTAVTRAVAAVRPAAAHVENRCCACHAAAVSVEGIY